jgi:hypothetical protein
MLSPSVTSAVGVDAGPGSAQACQKALWYLAASGGKF